MNGIPAALSEAVAAARAEVCRLHAALVDNGLVAWTSGNVSIPPRARTGDVPVPFPLARYGTKALERVCQSVLGRPSPVPSFFVEMLPHMQHYDCSKAIRELGYPRNPVEAAIHNAIQWFRDTRYLPNTGRVYHSG